MVGGVEVYPVKSLLDVIRFVNTGSHGVPPPPGLVGTRPPGAAAPVPYVPGRQMAPSWPTGRASSPTKRPRAAAEFF